jgi:hypothetical protein
MSKFTALAVHAEAMFHKLAAELRFLFDVLWVDVGTTMLGLYRKRTRVGLKLMRSIDARVCLLVFGEAK